MSLYPSSVEDYVATVLAGDLTVGSLRIEDDDAIGLVIGGSDGDLFLKRTSSNVFQFYDPDSSNPALQLKGSGSSILVFSLGGIYFSSTTLAQFYNNNSSAASYARYGNSGQNHADNFRAVRIGSFSATQSGKHIPVAFIVAGDTTVGGFGDGTVAPPTADVANRSIFWIEQGGAGVTDTLWVCLKSAADTYSWVSVVTGG